MKAHKYERATSHHIISCNKERLKNLTPVAEPVHGGQNNWDPPLPLILPHYRVAECATEFPPVQPMTITLFIFGTTPTCYQLINVYNLYPAQAGWALM